MKKTYLCFYNKFTYYNISKNNSYIIIIVINNLLKKILYYKCSKLQLL